MVFQWIHIVFHYLLICFYTLMKQTSLGGFSRIQIVYYPNLFLIAFAKYIICCQ